MKKLEFIRLRTVLLLFLCIYFNLVSGQTLTNRPNVNINVNCNGYVEFLPSNYNNNTDNYPLLIFFPGNSQWGPGTNASLQTVRDLGPNYYVNFWLYNQWYNFPGLVDLNKMVMISPQFIGPDFYTNPPTPSQMNDVVDYACNNYRIDRSRVYISGPSFGGRWSLEYAQAYPYRIAAIVPFAAAAYVDQTWADPIAAGSIPVWMVNNLYDGSVPPYHTQGWIAAINNPTSPIAPPIPLAYGSYPNKSGHEYDDNYIGLDTATNGLNKNMYQWMLQFSRPNHFIGGAGAAWENANNWSYKQVPTSNTIVVINTGPVIINSFATCKNITLRPGVNLTVNTGYKLTVTQ